MTDTTQPREQAAIDLDEIFAAIDEAQRQNRYNESAFAIGAAVARLKCLADEYRTRQAAPEAPISEQQAHLIVSTAAGADRLAVLVSVKRGGTTTVVYSRYHSMNGDSMGVESIPADTIATPAAATASAPTWTQEMLDQVDHEAEQMGKKFGTPRMLGDEATTASASDSGWCEHCVGEGGVMDFGVQKLCETCNGSGRAPAPSRDAAPAYGPHTDAAGEAIRQAGLMDQAEVLCEAARRATNKYWSGIVESKDKMIAELAGGATASASESPGPHSQMAAALEAMEHRQIMRGIDQKTMQGWGTASYGRATPFAFPCNVEPVAAIVSPLRPFQFARSAGPAPSRYAAPVVVNGQIARRESIAANHDVMIILTQSYPREAVIRVVDAHTERNVAAALTQQSAAQAPSRQAVCPGCKGKGVRPNHSTRPELVTCWQCIGTGRAAMSAATEQGEKP